MLDKARILTYGYDAYVVRKGVAGSNGLGDHASDLLRDLTADRTSCNAPSRPLIFVAHSLGGLVCKLAIIQSRNNSDLVLCDIFRSAKGIIFMGTPHRGSWIAYWAKMIVSALALGKSMNVKLLDILRKDNQLLEFIQSEFASMIRGPQRDGSLEVKCFFEELPLCVLGKVVSKKSATFEGHDSISVHANHRDMVRFASAEENGFKRFLGELKKLLLKICKSNQQTRSDRS
ncbi:hypothetical protein B0T17DRAFT_529871 [Bombardia bombarda]|uniref:DUF676 domain-containing protein n=1 Tax=Bombardia bombarda TaxID=252184 RepID=A0AA39XC49_9PEZI|nr:hypothetical protein B0T17DRAFT_529871 [Bombardia bombarda]